MTVVDDFVSYINHDSHPLYSTLVMLQTFDPTMLTKRIEKRRLEFFDAEDEDDGGEGTFTVLECMLIYAFRSAARALEVTRYGDNEFEAVLVGSILDVVSQSKIQVSHDCIKALSEIQKDINMSENEIKTHINKFMYERIDDYGRSLDGRFRYGFGYVMTCMALDLLDERRGDSCSLVQKR